MQERRVGDDIAIVTMTKEELRLFVATEVSKALKDVETLDSICDHCTRRMALSVRMQTGYVPRNIEYKSTAQEDLPDWARLG